MKILYVVSFIGILIFSVVVPVYADQKWPGKFPRITYWGRVPYDPVMSSFYPLAITSFEFKTLEKLNLMDRIRELNPETRVINYTSGRVAQTSNKVLRTYPGHYLFAAGSKIKKDIGPEDTIIEVADGMRFFPGKDAMFWDFTNIYDAEHINIIEVNGNKLKVERGIKGRSGGSPNFSPKRSHAKNTILAMHVGTGAGAVAGSRSRWITNPALLCERGIKKSCDENNSSYPKVLAEIIADEIAQTKADGTFIDFVTPYFTLEGSGDKLFNLVDIDNDLVPDKTIVGGRNLWAEGLLKFYEELRKRVGSKSLLIGNNPEPNRWLNGPHFESWDIGLLRDWKVHMQRYQDAWKIYKNPHLVNVQSDDAMEEDDPGNRSDFKGVRVTLAAALMNDGLFLGGRNWQYDEFDNGAGTSLVKEVPADINHKNLDISYETGKKFKQTDILYAAGEIMKVEQVINDPDGNQQYDRLVVQRNFVPEYNQIALNIIDIKPVGHWKGEKVWTADQMRNGLGYLGDPLEGPVLCLSENITCGRKFTGGVVLLNPTKTNQKFTLNETYYRINGTQDRSVNNGKKVTGFVTIPAKEGLILVKKPNLSPTPTKKPSLTPSPTPTKKPSLTVSPTKSLTPSNTPTKKPSITSSPAPTIKFPPGDGNKDGTVDGLDYLIWLNNYGTTTGKGAENGDYNIPPDGKVDGKDYVIWLNGYTD